MVAPLTRDFVSSQLQAEGYSLLSDYQNARSLIQATCPKGHPWSLKYDKFKQGNRCPTCAGNSKHTLGEIATAFSVRGYHLTSETYSHNKEKLAVICPNDHPWQVTFTNFQQGEDCPHCPGVLGRKPLTREEIIASVEAPGYTIVAGLDDVTTAHSYITVSCPKGHAYPVMVYNFQNGRRCPSCACHSSVGEREMFDFFISLVPDAVPGRRPLDGQEIDAWSPEKKVGVEYNGLYWHSEAGGKDRGYHLVKLYSAAEKGIRLLQFFEDEWRDRGEICRSLIRQALGVRVQKVGARDCELREVLVHERRAFLQANHLQGDAASKVAWGLFLDGQLLQVLALRTIAYTGGTADWEIARVASKIGVVVVGGLSRLVYAAKAWLKECGVGWLYTFADLRYSVGSSYLKAGFELVGTTSPGYWYTDFTKRVHRYNLRKTADCPVDLTELQWRNSQGWHRVWDCGQLRFRIGVNNHGH